MSNEEAGDPLEMRDTVRHVTDVPVEVLAESRPLQEPLVDVSRSGLSFRHPEPL